MKEGRKKGRNEERKKERKKERKRKVMQTSKQIKLLVPFVMFQFLPAA
jgi:hypothetical protein